MRPIISKRTQREFQESYVSHAVLRQIHQDFGDAGIQRTNLPEEDQPPGERRALVEEYYASVDWTSPTDVRKALDAFETHLFRLGQASETDAWRPLVQSLKIDGVEYRDGRLIYSPPQAARLDSAAVSALPAQSVDAAEIWLPGHFRLFISHLSSINPKVAQLQKELRKYQISAFVAHVDIEPSLEWQTQIEAALQTMEALTPVLTEGFIHSKWTDQEVGYALGRGILVVPVRAGADPYGFIGKIQGLPGSGKTAAALADDLFAVLVKHIATRERLAARLVARFENANSWSGARVAMDLLERVPQFTLEQTDRIERALGKNSEVQESHGVPGRVARLLAAHRERVGG